MCPVILTICDGALSVLQVQSSAIAQHARVLVQALDAPPQHIVCYGIGDIINSSIARLQLALALSIGNDLGLDRAAVSFFDPVLSAGGAIVLEKLGVEVTLENENCRRRVPDGGNWLFFMPHCDRDMYNNVVAANIVPEGDDAATAAVDEGDAGEQAASAVIFTKLSILGNSFQAYEERSSYDNAVRQCKYLLLGARLCVEQPLIDAGEEFGPGVFNDTALLTFPPV